jgi:predicted RNA-binding protein
MCEMTAFVVRRDSDVQVREKLLDSVDRVELDGDELTLTNIFGEQESLKGRLLLIDNREGKLLIERA